MKSPYMNALNLPAAGLDDPLRKKDTVIGTIGKTQGVSRAANPHRMASIISPQLNPLPLPVAEPSAASRSLIVDRERYLIVKEGQEIVLPRKEFELLALLYSKPQKVFSRDEIFSNVWGNDVIVGDRTIDVHIRKLREKLGDRHIVTVKGVGYKYED